LIPLFCEERRADPAPPPNCFLAGISLYRPAARRTAISFPQIGVYDEWQNRGRLWIGNHGTQISINVNRRCIVGR